MLKERMTLASMIQPYVASPTLLGFSLAACNLSFRCLSQLPATQVMQGIASWRRLFSATRLGLTMRWRVLNCFPTSPFLRTWPKAPCLPLMRILGCEPSPNMVSTRITTGSKPTTRHRPFIRRRLMAFLSSMRQPMALQCYMPRRSPTCLLCRPFRKNTLKNFGLIPR